jgi:hypothetical protein
MVVRLLPHGMGSKMEMKMNTLVLLVLLGLCISPSFFDLQLLMSSRFPQAQVEQLIKELN